MPDFTAIREAVDAADMSYRDVIAAKDAEIARLNALLAQRDSGGNEILWGSSVWKNSGETYVQALARTEKALGKLDIVRHFYPGAPAWPSTTGDRLLNLSFKLPPAEVAAGEHDEAFESWCSRAPDRPTWWTYWHEPEDDIEKGTFTSSAYRRAWTRLAGIAKGSGKDLRATLVLMEWTLDVNSQRTWRDYYPGDDVIDVLGWDAYHRKARNAIAVYATARRVSVEAGKPWAICETGVASDQIPAGESRSGLLFDLAHSAVTSDPPPEFVCYFDSPVGNISKAWPISNSPSASEAWVEGQGT